MIELKDPGLLCQACFIQDQWIEADSKKTVGVTNPATGEVLGTVPFCGADETRRAINAANHCLCDWRNKTAAERAAILRRWHDLLMENQEDLALIMAPGGDQTTCGRGCRHHPLELSQRHDHQKSRCSPGSRMHHGGQTSDSHPLFCYGHCKTGAKGGIAPRRF